MRTKSPIKGLQTTILLTPIHKQALEIHTQASGETVSAWIKSRIEELEIYKILKEREIAKVIQEIESQA